MIARDKERKREDYRDNRAARLQRSKDYYRENRTTVLQRVKSHQQTPESRQARQTWIAKNPEKVVTYRQRQKQSYREKKDYNPEGRTCKKCNGAIEVGRGHRAKWCEKCSRPSPCVVCGNRIGKTGPGKFEVDPVSWTESRRS